ncbi:MAG: hypothetical protein ACPHJ3_15545, partial [Rubripirellula sp.]
DAGAASSYPAFTNGGNGVANGANDGKGKGKGKRPWKGKQRFHSNMAVQDGAAYLADGKRLLLAGSKSQPKKNKDGKFNDFGRVEVYEF